MKMNRLFAKMESSLERFVDPEDFINQHFSRLLHAWFSTGQCVPKQHIECLEQTLDGQLLSLSLVSILTPPIQCHYDCFM